VAADEVLLQDVTGATTVELADASPSELIRQLNEAARHFSLLPLIILLWLPVVTIPLAILLRVKDKARRTVVVFYEVEGPSATRFQALVDSFTAAEQCAAHWHVTAQGAVVTTRQYKVNAGASAILRRDRGRADLAGPPVFASNIAVPSLHASKRSVYFLPARSSSVTAVSTPTCPPSTAASQAPPPGSLRQAGSPRTRNASGPRENT
jgi:DNA polymerase-3 subunit epsilon